MKIEALSGLRRGAMEAAVKYLKDRYPLCFQLFELGKLTGDWGNVADHEAAAALAVLRLGAKLGLPKEVIEKLAANTLIHDATMRMEKKPKDFLPEELTAFWKLHAGIGPIDELMRATKPEFTVMVFTGQLIPSLEEAIVFLCDDMAAGSSLVHPLDRITATEKRNPNPLANSDELLKQLGGTPYWDAERLVIGQVSEQIQLELRSAGVEIERPDLVPERIIAWVREWAEGLVGE